MVRWMKAPNKGDQSDRTKEIEKEVDFLRKDRDATQRRLDKALAENERLRKALEEALRSLKRQAAPFSKGDPKPNPKRPGRKPGAQYGERASRPVPARGAQEIPVPLPKKLSLCCEAGHLRGDQATVSRRHRASDNSCADSTS